MHSQHRLTPIAHPLTGNAHIEATPAVVRFIMRQRNRVLFCHNLDGIKTIAENPFHKNLVKIVDKNAKKKMSGRISDSDGNVRLFSQKHGKFGHF